MHRFVGLSFALVLACSSSQASAAVLPSVSASANDIESGDGNSDSQIGFTTASALYSNPHGGSAEAFATISENLGIPPSLKAKATATGGSGEEGQYISNRASASASWEDEISFRSLVRLNFDLGFRVTGSHNGDASYSFASAACRETGECLSLREATLPNNRLVITAIDFAQPYEVLSIVYSLNVKASGYGTGNGGPNSSTADYSHTVELVSITPRDEAGNYLPDVTITSASGLDYTALVMNVPEPTSAALLLLASAIPFVQGRARSGLSARRSA